MKKNLTELVFILDKSGSMGGMESDTIGGFNSMIEKQKKEDGECLVSCVLFDNDSEVIYDRVPVDQVKPMTLDDYCVGGCTALVDSLGGAIHHISNVHKYIREEDRPENTIFIITTDGYENASHKYTAKKLKKMVSEKTKNGWEFIYMAANIDAVSTGANFGIRADRAINYNCDSEGTAIMYDAVCEAVSNVRSCRKMGSAWAARVNDDYKARGRK
ncbi:MAG: VWA domain-containing protein [Saccharofermentans sp.]|nr:VWA domain-containing protein [Saccharofermentans sp.]